VTGCRNMLIVCSSSAAVVYRIVGKLEEVSNSSLIRYNMVA
jgi:hypothetical protein